MSDELDKILNDIEAENLTKEYAREQLRAELTPDEDVAQRLRTERQEKVEGFKLTLDLEDEPAEPTAEDDKEIPLTGLSDQKEEAVPLKKKRAPKKKKKKGFFGGGMYLLLVLLLSLLLAAVVLVLAVDISGLTKSDEKIPVTIPKGATTEQIANILHEKGVIDNTLVFRLYSRFTDADGTYQPHEDLDLSPSMGYSAIIAALQESKPRESVKVTIPEGYTIKEIAVLLEKNNVCTKTEFLEAVEQGDYSEFSFVKELPTAETDERYKSRLYRLEGYLFPDTYDFYVGGSAETVVRKMLRNFDKRMDTSILTGIRAKGLTIDEAVILASIIQKEVSNSNDMARVSRVLHNRLAEDSPYPRLECCTTQQYLNAMVNGRYDDESDLAKAYDTYLFAGMPVGAIGNPGLDALKAVTQPSSEDSIQKCYFFVADTKTGITYFNRTYDAHRRKCRELGLNG